MDHKHLQSMKPVPLSLGCGGYRFREDLAVSGEVQSGVGEGRGHDQNQSHEAITAYFTSEQDDSPPKNSLLPPNKLRLSFVSAGEELVTSYISAV